MYIGSSSNLGTRLRTHASIVKRNPAGTFARTYRKFNYDRKFKTDQIEIQWAIISEYKEVEKKLLIKYLIDFLDTPPCNLRVGKT